MLHKVATTEAVTEAQPPMKVHLEQLHVLRQIDGEVLIRSSSISSSRLVSFDRSTDFFF